MPPHNDHCSGAYTRIEAGAPTVLPEPIEKEIILTCQLLAEMGFGTSLTLLSRNI